MSQIGSCGIFESLVAQTAAFHLFISFKNNIFHFHSRPLIHNDFHIFCQVFTFCWCGDKVHTCIRISFFNKMVFDIDFCLIDKVLRNFFICFQTIVLQHFFLFGFFHPFNGNFIDFGQCNQVDTQINFITYHPAGKKFNVRKQICSPKFFDRIVNFCARHFYFFPQLQAGKTQNLVGAVWRSAAHIQTFENIGIHHLHRGSGHFYRRSHCETVQNHRI